MKNNATTAGTYLEANATVETPLNLIIQPKWFDANYYQPGYFGAVMMQYEPTLPINRNNPIEINIHRGYLIILCGYSNYRECN
ncbi:MAG: hypothetical protein H6615_06665 [Ignavibacteria bacterium]|nr:hypothetical protein [Ignavibacteria bacterium]